VVEGVLFLVCYTGVGLVLPVALPYVLGPQAKAGSWLQKLCNGLQGFYEKRGPTIYTIEMLLLLGMIGILVKMILRLFFNVKYILAIPAINLNI
jgi:hypothetical protein